MQDMHHKVHAKNAQTACTTHATCYMCLDLDMLLAAFITQCNTTDGKLNRLVTFPLCTDVYHVTCLSAYTVVHSAVWRAAT